jgi:tetratricopeptide (TPR) repeat protein
MLKRFAILFPLIVLMAALTASAAAQNVLIRGICRDEAGNPIRSGTVEFQDLASGKKVQAKTGERGEYNTVDVMPGTHKITLFDSRDKQLFYFDKAEIKSASQYDIDFNLAKLRAEAEKNSPEIQEQRKEAEKIKQQNEDIRAVNALLLQAAQQKKDKQYTAALETMQHAAAQDQTHDVVYAALADAYVLNQKFAEAEDAYTRAIALAPAGSKSLGGYHAGLALTLSQQGKMEAGLAECERTAQVDSAQGGLCYFNAGAILTNQGNAELANQAFDKSIAADPSRADAYYQKGVNLLSKATLSSDNKMVPAPGTIETLGKYLELAPDGKYAQSAKDLLASLGASVQSSYGTEKKGEKKGRK